MKYEAKILYHTALLVVGNIASAAAAFQLFIMSTKSVLFSERYCQKSNWLLKGRLLIFNIVIDLQTESE